MAGCSFVSRPIGPQGHGKFINPLAPGLFQSFLQNRFDDLIYGFDLAICLRVCNSGEFLMDMESQTEILEFSAVKLGSVIDDNSMREIEPTDDIAYYKVDNFLHRVLQEVRLPPIL